MWHFLSFHRSRGAFDFTSQPIPRAGEATPLVPETIPREGEATPRDIGTIPHVVGASP